MHALGQIFSDFIFFIHLSVTHSLVLMFEFKVTFNILVFWLLDYFVSVRRSVGRSVGGVEEESKKYNPVLEQQLNFIHYSVFLKRGASFCWDLKFGLKVDTQGRLKE